MGERFARFSNGFDSSIHRVPKEVWNTYKDLEPRPSLAVLCDALCELAPALEAATGGDVWPHL